MFKKLTLVYICLVFGVCLSAQSGTEFWLAPPEVTVDHNSPGDVPIYLNLTSFSSAATVTISQPANAGFTPIVIALGANSSHRETLSAFKNDLETKPTNTILTTGLLVESTETISAYYEVSNTNNPDIMSLKGENGLGTEFYIPLHNHAPFWNHNTFTDIAYSAFDIVATEDNTTILIFSPVDLDGHPALDPFTITLDKGETYSAAWTGANYEDPDTNPAGAAVVSDKPIAISIKDDSVHNPSGGCYDFMGDQIIPVDILGTEYVAVKGFLNATGDESAFVMATQNNTKVYLDGSTTEVATLFAGQYYRVDMDYLSSSSDNSVLINTSRPTYVNHVTGFGCESGMALLPPMNCAGSEQVSFVRSTSENFYLNIMVRSGSENDFTITGPGTASINPATFIAVPGTAGEWLAGQFSFNTTEIPVDAAHLISNSSDVFTLGIINGGGTTGCRYGYFSEFVGVVEISAGADQTVCVNQSASLTATVDGGAKTGIWTTSGSGSFSPSDTDLNADYIPSAADYSLGMVTLTITSTGQCDPESDSMDLTFQDEPLVDAGTDEDICSNNSDIALAATIVGATGGDWTGGSGSYSPNASTVNAVYTPTNGEILSGSVTLTLTSTGNGNCGAISDDVTFTFTPPPTVDAGVDISACENNADLSLSATTTVATGGFWTGGSGTYSPSNTFLNCTYTPTAAEISSGSITLTVTTSGNGNCIAVSDDITITFSSAPTVNAGADDIFCANNSDISLDGSIGGASGGSWSGGLGTFTPNNLALTGIYTPSASELSNGFVTLTLSTTGNGSCNAETDDVTFTFTDAPTVDAGADQTECGNSPDVVLGGSFTIATGAVWSGGTGTFTPNNTTMNATYSPTPGEISTGSVTLTLTTTGNGDCTAVSDDVVITYEASPTVNAGVDISVCENNADTDLSGSISGAPSGIWSGGSGTYSPNNTTLNATYTPTAAEISSGSLTLTLTSSGVGACSIESDEVDVVFTNSPSSDAGLDADYCENNAAISLEGDVDLATGGQWTGGSGSFNPDATTLTTVYTPSAAELSSGSVTLTLVTTGNGNCASVSDPVTYTFTSAPTADAGLSQTLCANNADASLSGSKTGASGVLWTGGSGTFSPNANDENAIYSPTSTEIDAGSIVLTISTTGNGNCLAVDDQMTMNFTPAPSVSAGTSQSLCENNPDVSLNGTISIATGGIWSGGLGTYSPNNTTLNATYTPTAAEVTAGSIDLILTSTGNGDCSAEDNSIEVTYTSAPSVDAGTTDTFCENNSEITLDGSFSNAGGISWSGGLGTFSPNNQTINAMYTPSQSELDAGMVSLTISSTGNGGCLSSSDNVDYSFTDAPTVNAGADQFVCETVTSVELTGSFTLSTGAKWSGGAGSFLPSDTDMNAQYFPTPTEKATGSVKLKLTTTGNGTCIAVEDEMEISFQNSPFVNAGSDLISCENNSEVELNGFVGNALGAEWTGGAGNFFPSNDQNDPTYTPTAAEIASGTLTLTYTTTGNGVCSAQSDQVVLDILPAPISDAGIDISVCSNNPEVALSGLVTNASGGTWMNGFGSFSPSPTLLNTTYSPVQAEIDGGFITLILETTGNGPCNAAQDNINITFTDSPIANAGPDLTICQNSSDVDLNGSVTIATDGYWSGGSGLYTPNDSLLSTTYLPTPTELDGNALTFVLTTFNNGNCLAVTDTLEVVIIKPADVDAGEDITACVSDSQVALDGLVSGITNTGEWSTLGTGTFTPNNTNLNGNYNISQADSLAGEVTLILSSTNNSFCGAVQDTVTLDILPPGLAFAGNDTSVCANNASIDLNGIISGNATTGFWETTGTGAFIPDENTLNATYVPSAGDVVNGSIIVSLTANSCNLGTDEFEIHITPEPEVDAGLDEIICSDQLTIEINGAVSGASTTGVWTTLGNGSFVDSTDELSNTYQIDSLDIVNQQVELVLNATNSPGCVAVSDTIFIDIYQEAIVNAGQDTTLCANNGVIGLSGTITNGDGPKWVSSGSGTFSSNTSLTTNYIPSEDDISAGFVSLILSSEESCNNASDLININFTAAPIVNAGSNFVVCSSNTEFNLSGAVTGFTTDGIWTTSGDGTLGDEFDMNSTYSVGVNEFDQGGTTIFLTSQNNANCLAVVDSVQIIYTDGIVANAGSDQAVCEGTPSTSLSGLVANGSTTGIWSSSGTGNFSDDEDLNSIYTFSTADSLAGEITVYLTSTNNGDCDVITDSLDITFGASPTVNAGGDVFICGSDTTVALSGFIAGANPSANWESSGTGYFDSEISSNTNYHLSSADVLNGYIELILGSESTAFCDAAEDVLIINVEQAPVVFGGDDIVKCQLDTVPINALVAYADGVVWTTTGSGVIENDSLLSTIYVPTIADSLAGWVNMYATTFGSSFCEPDVDTLKISFGSGEIPDAGVDQLVCADGSTVILNGSVSSGDVEWSSTGTGSFSPNNTDINTEYIPSSLDLLIGEVDILLETISGFGCQGVDTIHIDFDPLPEITPMEDMSVCQSVDTISISGIVANADSINWTGLGSGELINSNSSELSYVPSDGDLTSGSVVLIMESFSASLCTSPSDTIEVFFTNDLSADFEAENSCSGQETQFNDMTVVSVGNAVGWAWNLGDGTVIQGQNIGHVYDLPGDYEVTLSVFNSTGCTDEVTQTISVTDAPTSSFLLDEEGNVGEAVNTIDLSTDAVDWEWDFGDGTSLNTNQEASHVYTVPGEYFVILEVTNSLGCSDTTGSWIKVGGDFVFPPNLPNAFSPNGDNENDVFMVRGGPFTEMTFVVYNGWGQVIFETSELGVGWDGTHKGKNEPVGVYVYTVKAITIEGDAFVKSGKVSLIR